MPLNVTKPFATTNICHLVEMMSMLGLVWKEFDMKKEVRKLARERVGTVPSSRPILPKSERTKPKHKKPAGEEDAEHGKAGKQAHGFLDVGR